MTTTKSKLFAAAAAFATTVTFSATASATVFSNDYHEAGVWSSYDDQNEVYAMKYRSDLGKNGFWLVLSDGDNPKGDGTDYAILYGDMETNRITAYTYNGENNANSYEAGTLLGTFDGAFSDGGQHHRYGYDMTMFNLDVAGINSALGGDWKGVVSGAESGIWFHQSAGSEFTYGADGGIEDYSFDTQMWLDRGNVTDGFTRTSSDCVNTFDPSHAYLQGCTASEFTTAQNNVGGTSGGTTSGGTNGGGSVPAPGGLALILAGIAGIGFMRRNRKKA